MKVIRFTASWCQPCQQLSRTLETMNVSMPVEVIDIDENSEIASEFGIRSVPTLVMVDGLTEVKRLVGARTKEELQGWFNG